MASIYQLEPEKLFVVPNDDKVTECKLCYEIAQPKDGIDLGPLFQYGKIVRNKSNESKSTGEKNANEEMEIYCAHYFCLLFCSALSQRGEDDAIGIKGFLTEDILKEWRRASRLKCFKCNKKYATVGCAAKKCRKSFHLPCALRDNALPQFCSEFRLYCGEHRLKQFIYNVEDPQDVGERECGICSEELSAFPEDSIEEEMKNIWTPCCNKWFHKECIQKFASTAGYFFKCPLCNNKEIFESEMQSFGVYVPEQDAAWETQDNGTLYDDLLERYNRCDAVECLCPDGREADEDYTIWEIILCWCCGAQGIHVKCGNLPLSKDMVKWKCNGCLETIRKMPKRTIHRFKKIDNSRSKKPLHKQNRQMLKDILDNTSINLINSNTGTSEGTSDKAEFYLNDLDVSARIDLCPKYDIPLPVKLSNVPWVEKDPGLETLEKMARLSAPIVQLEKMELKDMQYSVYTVWRPTIRNSVPKLAKLNSSEPLKVHDKDKLCTPSKSNNGRITLKPRSPSLPKSIARKCTISPRSQSLPPLLNDKLSSDKDSSLSHYDNVESKLPHSKNSTNTPKKIKFLGKFKKNENLATLKPIEHIVDRGVKPVDKIYELFPVNNKRPKSLNDDRIKRKSLSSLDVLAKKSLTASKVLREKRSNLDSPHKSRKKMKYQDNGFLPNECSEISDTGKAALFKNENGFYDEEMKENSENSKTTCNSVKKRSNHKDLKSPNSQRSILQYFSAQ